MEKIEKSRVRCQKCYRYFKNQKGLSIHNTHAHPYVAPKPQYLRETLNHNLLNGRNIKIGDRLIFTQEVVVKKITLTKLNFNAIVDVDVVTDAWANKN